MQLSERRATVLRLVVASTVLVGGYLGLCAWSAQHVPASVSVGGIQIGGMSAEQAVAAIDKGSRSLLATPITLTVPASGGDGSGGSGSASSTGAASPDDGAAPGAQPLEIVPGEAGFAVDAERSLEGLTGFTLSPGTVWSKLTGSIQAPLLTKVDDAKLTSAVTALAPRVEVAAVEGAVTFPGGKVEVREPVQGSKLDVATTKLALRRAFPHSTTASAAISPVEPKVTAQAVRAAADGFGAKAMSGPITVVAGSATAQLAPADYAPAVSLVPDGAGGLKPAFDDAKLAAVLKSKVQIATRPPADARWVFEAGRPKLVPAVDGLTLNDATVSAALQGAMTSDTRKADVKATVMPPKFTTAAAQKAGIKELIVDFTSPFPPEDVTRTNNLIVAARTINGTYVAPGQTFSLNKVLGERTTAKGYKDGTVIINGRLTRGTGGGVSQVSTTIYNMAYFAGADILEFTSHAFFIPRYPEGREATVYWPTVDNKWKNDTPYGMLLQTWVADGYVHGRVWSTKYWNIKSVKSARRNVVQPRTIEDNSATCYPQQPQPGFDVTVTRQWYRPGSTTLVKSEPIRTHYIPEHRVICTNPDAKP